MKKPFSLHQFLVKRTPWLNTDPDHLVILVENGQIAVTGVHPNLSHEHQYQLTVTLLDFEHDPEEIIVPMLEWLTTHQSDLLDNSDWQQNGLSYDLVVIDKNKVDFTIRMRLTERIIACIKDEAAQDSRARYAVETADEPLREAIEKYMRTSTFARHQNATP